MQGAVGALAVEASQSARETSTPRTPRGGEASVEIRKERVFAAKNTELGAATKGVGSRKLHWSGLLFWGFTAAGSDAARRLSCGGPGTEAKLFLQPEAKALPAQ